MSEYYDKLETRSADQRAKDLAKELPAIIARAKASAPAYATLLADHDPAEITGPEALAGLPLTRKNELIERQAADPPYAGLTTIPTGDLACIYQSPGPIYDAEGRTSDYWRVARALFAAGFRKGDILHNCFAYHFTPAGAMIQTGAGALGCAVVPAGPGQTEQQIQAIRDVRPTGYAGTPSFLKIILEKADEMGEALPSLKRALVAGEALFPAVRQGFADRGIEVCQFYGTADLGSIAYESEARDGLIVDEGVIVEIVRPGTGQPVAEGEVGEVVVTTTARAYPLIRFATGDLSCLLPGDSPCGRTNRRLKGWMGRADQGTKIKGMFVHPPQVAAIVSRHPEVTRARLVVTGENNTDIMTLVCETGAGSDTLRDALAASVRAVTKLGARIDFTTPGALPNDGIVIEDARKG
ncbi:MAG: AMP-binding protein [Rhodospirillales bacterium]